ncbi:MAG: phage tail protein [Clostridiales bacterium]|nr:phage tail protein [Clostridiales bacterium]
MDNFGLRIGIEGERDFRAALRDINQSFKVLGSEMTLVSAQFDKNDKSIQAVTARNEVLNKEIAAQKDKIVTLKSALENASASFGENDKRTQAWAIQLNTAQAALIGMEKELDQSNKALEEEEKGFKDAGDGAENFADKLEDTVKTAGGAGGKFEELGGILKGVGAALGAAVAAVGAAAVAATKSLTDMAVGTAAYADNFLTMSSVTGMSAESLQAYSYAADLVDVSLETLTGSMAKQVKSMDAARDGNKQIQAAYAALGVSVTDAEGKLRGGETVYWEAIDALGKMEEGTERDALAMQIFGKSAQELNPLIAQGSAGIAELTEEAKRMGAVMSDDQLAQAGAFDDVIQRLTQGSNAAKNALGMVLMPQLTALGTDGVELLGNFTRGLNESGGDWTKISEVIGETVGGLADMLMEQLPQIIDMAMSVVGAIGGAIMENLPVLIDAASQIVITLLQGLIEALPGLTEGAVQLVTALVGGILENLPALVEAAAQMISTLAAGISETLPQLIPAAIQAVMEIVKGLTDNLPLLLDAALKLVLGLAEGIVAAIPELVKELPAVIQSIVDFVIDAIPQIIEAGIQLFVALVGALPQIITAIVEAIPQIIDGVIMAVIDSIPILIDAGVKLFIALIENLPLIITTIVEAAPKIITSVVDALIGNIDKIIMAGVKLFVALIENLPAIIAAVVKAVPQIISALIRGFTGYGGEISAVGGRLIEGLWKGISDAGAWLWEKISGFFGNVVSRIKDFFGIHSPSEVFAGLGANMGEGIGAGFEKVMAGVSRDMQNAIPSSLNLPNLKNGLIDFSAITGGLSGAPVITINNTFNGVTASDVPYMADRANNALLRRLVPAGG